MSIRMIFNPQFGGKEKTYADIETLMRKNSLNAITAEGRKVLERAMRTGDLVYGSFNPYESEMSSGEETPVHELMVETDKEILISRFYGLSGDI